MAHYEESLIIKASPKKVYEVTRDVVGFLERVPEYKVTVLEKNEQQVLVKCSTRYLLVVNSYWHTLVDVSNPQEIRFEQVKGPLKGLRATWKYAPVAEDTRVTISHDFVACIHGIPFNKLPLIPKPLENWIYGYSMENVANGILNDMKTRVEARDG